MDKFISIVALQFFFTIAVHGQDVVINGVLFNKTQKNPASFVTVGVHNINKYRDADINGNFEITAKSSDSLIFSGIGYKKCLHAVSEILLKDTIFLETEYIENKPVIILKPKVETFGLNNAKKDRTCTGGSEAGRYELVTLVKIPEIVKAFRLSKIFIKGKDFSNENPVRLHIYNIDSNGLPGTELLTKEIIITSSDKKDMVTIDVKEQNIVIENNSFFAGLQWITSDKVKMFTGPQIFETFEEKSVLTFRRSLLNRANSWYAFFRKGIFFFPSKNIPQNDTPINALIFAEVEVFTE